MCMCSLYLAVLVVRLTTEGTVQIPQGFTISHNKKSEDDTNTVIICCAYFEVRFLRRERQDGVTIEKRGIPGTYLKD